jgi:hypothetical protein
MFCPGCGLEEKNANQFCRACGADMRIVRTALERPDNITASAESAREEIGRAIAAKIRETQTTYDLKKVAEDVLPEIEKFLESPAEKRMRRIRTGTIISLIGLGAILAFTMIAILIQKEDMLFIAGMGVVCFFIGLSFFINGLLFTVPKKSLEDRSEEADTQRALDVADPQTNELVPPESKNLFSSVTENTTRHLKEKQPIPRD